MHSQAKEWLVRTRTGEILGPFTQRELFEELQKRTFTVDDEIAPSLGHWISAQALGNRDADEFTRTATRSQAFTRSIHTATSTSTVNTAKIEAGKPASSPQATEEEELTPTPDFETPHRPDAVPRVGAGLPPLRRPAHVRPHQPVASRLAPLFTLILLLGGVWALVTQMRAHKPVESTETPVASGTTPASTSGDSPFVRQVYEMIHRGETKAALQQLTQYHERNGGKGDLEYLIPYAALLIMERDSIGRAQKFLEQVLNSKATAAVKAQAHHWLGYLMLDQDEGDKGLAHFLDSLQLNPKDPASRFELGQAYLLQGKASQALDYFQLAELERPDLWLIHLHKALAREELNQLDEAKASFQRAIALSPDRWMSYMFYAVFLNRNGDTTGAQNIIKKMLTRDPKFELNSPAPWGFYRDRVHHDKYLEAFNEIMTRAAGEEKELGKLYLNYLHNQGQGGEGSKIEAVAEKGGLMAKVLGLKVVLDRDASAAEIRTAANRLPPLLGDFGYYAYVLRGEARLRLGNYVEAESDLKRALELEPQSAVARFSMAVLAQRMKRTEDARNRLRELLATHPNYIPAILVSRTF